MSHTFGDYPTLGFAVPFENLSFSIWTDTTYPDQWELDGSGTDSDCNKYTPGFDQTRGMKLEETPGGAVATANNAVGQTIAIPDYFPNGQATRIGYCAISDLEGSYGAAYASVILYQITGGTQVLASYSLSNSTTWQIAEVNSTNNVNTSTYSDFKILCQVISYNSEADPAGAFDCLKVEYGRSTSERYWTFTRAPELSGLKVEEITFREDERGGRGDLRSYDSTGGAIKWRITMPFENVPESFVEAINDFWRKSRGLEDGIARPLCLTHYLTDPTAAATSGEDYLKRPPWIICQMVKKDFQHFGSFLGAGMYDGVIVFEEI